MRFIFQKKKPKADQGASSTWIAALPQTKNYQRGNSNHQQSSQTHDFLGSRSRKWGSFFKFQGTVLRTTLEELGHTQPPTPMEIDNTTITGYRNGTIKQKRTKSMDMHFYWIKDRVQQGQFNVYWGRGYQNLADYFTKHHSPAHHKRMREIYIHADERPINQKGV
jgi:hypothetical protein